MISNKYKMTIDKFVKSVTTENNKLAITCKSEIEAYVLCYIFDKLVLRLPNDMHFITEPDPNDWFDNGGDATFWPPKSCYLYNNEQNCWECLPLDLLEELKPNEYKEYQFIDFYDIDWTKYIEKYMIVWPHSKESKRLTDILQEKEKLQKNKEEEMNL